MFLKVKMLDDTNGLVNVEQVSSVVVLETGVQFDMKNGDTIRTKMGFQTLTNRLAELSVDVAK